MDFFYSNNINDDIITFDSVESRHCIKVMRRKMGDMVNVVDGKGNLYICNIFFIDKKSCKVKINQIHKDYNKRNYYLHIAISSIKNHDRLEWFIEKSVEIGVDEITLINCSRTLRKNIKIDRLYKTAISAMKQSLKAYLPKINDAVDINSFVKNNNQSNKFICHLENDNRKDLFYYKNTILKNRNTCLLIGPEGDFNLDEINICKNHDFHVVSLGESRLRTETAGVVACQISNIINNINNE